MTSDVWRRAAPWGLLAAILAVGITAVVEVGTHGGGQTSVSQVGSIPSPGVSASASPSAASRSAAANLVPSGASSTTEVSGSSATPTATDSPLPKLSDTHPDYPPTETLVDKKDGLIVAVYTVKHGDYLSEIASRFQSPLTDVYVWSKNAVGPNADLIYAGQQIVVKVLAKI
jgi:LysM repeat protein